MKESNKRTLKGFTLIELIIVMAIFSVLMVGVMRLVDPVSRIFTNTSASERAYSNTNNIQVYLQSKLEYSDNIWVYTGDKIGDPDTVAAQFRDNYYKNVVTSDDGSTTKFVDGKIYVMRLSNSGNDSGQIYLKTYDFTSNSSSFTSISAEEPQLNDAYFNADDAVYRFNYALGANKTVSVDVGGKNCRVLENDFNDTDYTPEFSKLSLSIALYKVDKDNAGNIIKEYFNDTGSYRAYESPCAFSAANLPLTNLAFSWNNNGHIRRVKRMIMDGGEIKRDDRSTPAEGITQATRFYANAAKNVDFSNDIYFIYAYADELK